jgi:hypothetical protein
MKRLTIVAGALVVLWVGLLAAAYYQYKQKIATLETAETGLQSCFEQYRHVYQRYPTAEQLMNFIPVCRPAHSELYSSLKLGIAIDAKNVTIYEYGFDGNDDYGGVLYGSDQVSFFRSFIIVGDALVTRFEVQPLGESLSWPHYVDERGATSFELFPCCDRFPGRNKIC